MVSKVIGTDSVEVVVSLDELRIINNALNEVSNALEQWEFETRMGAKPEEAKALLRSVREILDRAEQTQGGG
jgi:hypothetical protein